MSNQDEERGHPDNESCSCAGKGSPLAARARLRGPSRSRYRRRYDRGVHR